MNHLLEGSGYDLVAVSGNGVNVFFVRSGINCKRFSKLAPEAALQPKLHPDGRVARTDEVWADIEHLPYVDVTTA